MGARSTTVVCCSLFIALLLTKGDAQSLSCDSNIAQPLCPGTITKCTCASGGTLTRWNFTTLNPCPNNFNFIALTQQAPCSSSLLSASGTCGAYLSAATNNPSQAGSACPSSTLNITANQALNGLTIECRDVSSALPGTLIGTGNINIAAPPSAPNITSLISTYSDQLTVTWTSVPTATSYYVRINDSVYTPVPIPSTGAPQYTFTGLTNNTVYTVSVVVMNCAGNSTPATMSNRTSNGPTAPPTPVTSVTSPTTAQPNNIALGVGIGVGVGVPVLLAVILVTVGVVYCTSKGGNTSSKIRNEEASPDAGSPDHKGPSKPPRAKQTSPSGGEAPKPAAKPKEALMYADVRSVNTKSNGNKSAQPPANKKYDDGVAYSDIKH